MSSISFSTFLKNMLAKFKFTNRGADREDMESIETFAASESEDKREPDFSELHALFEIQYEQFLSDTRDEIAKRAQRLVELESIVTGIPNLGK